jgi:hypothetical protein
LVPVLENYRTGYRHLVVELFPARWGTYNDSFQAALAEHQSHSLPEYSEAAVRLFIAHPAVASDLTSEGLDPEAMVDSLMRTLADS